MTKPDLLKERDEQALDWRLNNDCTCEDPDVGTCWYHLSDREKEEMSFKAGFDAAIRLMEERRVKPLREAIAWIAKGHNGGPKIGAECQRKSIEALAAVPSFEEGE